MRKAVTKATVVNGIARAIGRLTIRKKNFEREGLQNPQVKEVYLITLGKLEALHSVQQALRYKNMIDLTILGD